MINALSQNHKEPGWNSSDQLCKAKNELIERGFIVISRQGGRNLCNLYAVTLAAIDDCKGKLDIGASNKALNSWKYWKPSSKGCKDENAISITHWSFALVTWSASSPAPVGPVQHFVTPY